MEIISRIFPDIIRIMVDLLRQPTFWVVVFIVGLLYRRVSKNRYRMFGIKGEPLLRQTLQALVHGLLGGLAGSLFMILMGISFEEIVPIIPTLLLLSVLLMMVSPHLLCFSYSGGLLSLSFILLGFPKVNVPQLMGLVAILHIVESVLILISGHLGAVPMFTRNENGEVMGGFTLQKFWPIPVVALTFAAAYLTPETAISAQGRPDWWPLLRPDLTAVPNLFFALTGVVAVLGYGDLALARTPMEKSRLSARNLGAFSLVLLLLAYLASRYPGMALVAALFSPLGHEFVIYLGQKSELEGKPLYVPPEKGVMLLEVIPGTPADKAGLQSADVILSLNGQPVNGKAELEEAIFWHPPRVEVEYFSRKNKGIARETVLLKYDQPFGVIPVPQGDEPFYAELKLEGFFRKLWKKLRK